ncbi:MAG: dihydropteroate synthase [Chloroflexi bacterium]|nr:dihydropteroate synthase [Chloroflexota bacterium]
MLVIGECIHIIAIPVRKAIDTRDKAFIQNLALHQVKAGSDILDLNIGPQRKLGHEIMPWLVNAIQEVTDKPLSLDTTNPLAIEAGLKVCKNKAIINSTDATEERLSALMPMAARYNCDIVALSLTKGGLPTSTDARIELASQILAVAAENGVPSEHIWLDPLVLTVNGNQDQTIQTIEAIRFFKQIADPAPMTTCGLSNISNSCPEEIRPILNRVFMVMMKGAGLDSAIANPLDEELMETLRILQERDSSSEKGSLFLGLYDAYRNSMEFDVNSVNTTSEEIKNLIKTINIMQNKTLYAHSYLRL